MKDKMITVKIGAVTRVIPKGALQPYLDAKWKVVENEVKTNTKKPTTA